jgi:hypothetical protein
MFLAWIKSKKNLFLGGYVVELPPRVSCRDWNLGPTIVLTTDLSHTPDLKATILFLHIERPKKCKKDQ